MSVLGALKTVDEWSETVRLAYDAMRELGGEPALVADVLSSPWAGLAMIAGGMAYVVFVGEPKQGVQRHPGWPVLGWSVFGVCLTALLVGFGYGMLEVYVREQVAVRNSPVWHPTEEQKHKLGLLLDQTPEAERFDVKMGTLIGSTQSQTYGGDLIQLFIDHHWKATGSMDATIRPDLVGLYICISPDIKSDAQIPVSANWLSGAFVQAGIKHSQCTFGVPKDGFIVLIGSRPPR
jgi:hypothetical protein